MSKLRSSLDLKDGEGKRRAALMTTEFGSGLLLYDEKEETQVELSNVAHEDGPGLFVHDKRGKCRAGLTVDKNRPRLDLYDEKGKVIWSAP